MKILFEKREPSWDSQERLLSSFEYSQPGGTKGTTGGLRRGSERLINLKVIRPGLPSFPSSCFFFYFFFFFYTGREFITRLNCLDSISRFIASLTFMRDVVPSFEKRSTSVRVSPPCNCHVKVSRGFDLRH